MFFSLQLKGPGLSQKALEEAALVLQTRHPVFRCVIGQVDGVYVLEEQAAMRIPVETHPRTSASSWQEYYKAHLEHVPLQLYTPPHKIHLFQSPDSDIFEVVLDLQHFCSDGAAMGVMAHELMELATQDAVRAKALAEERPSHYKWASCMEHLVDERSSLAWQQSGVLGFAVSLARAMQHINKFVAFPVSAEGRKQTAQDVTHLNKGWFSIQSMPKLELKQFITACKREKASVTSAIMAASSK